MISQYSGIEPKTKVLLVTRLKFMIHTFVNLYTVDENNKPLIGEPLPSQLTTVHKGAHFMTLDKVVAEMKMSDA